MKEAYTCVMRQYSSCGRLNGWAGNLDLNKFYGGRERIGINTPAKEIQLITGSNPKSTVNTPGRVCAGFGSWSYAGKIR